MMGWHGCHYLSHGEVIQMSDCNRCLWATRNGSCASWDCKFVDQREAYEAYNRGKADANKWIPVSERLPEEDTEVLGTDRDGCIRHVVKDKSSLYEFATYEEMMHIDIVAWMPLPDPYKEDKT